MARTTTHSSTDSPVSGNGHRHGGGLQLEPPKRRIQLPQLAIGVIVVALSALVAVIVYAGATASQPVLAAAGGIERGQVIEVADLMVVEIATDSTVASVPASAVASLAGRRASVDIESGTILTMSHVVDRTVVDAGDGVVGLALTAGEYPTARLVAGDIVDVVIDAAVQGGGPVTVVGGAVVFEVTDVGTQGGRFVSLQMTQPDAVVVASAAADGRVRLILVGGDS